MFEQCVFNQDISSWDVSKVFSFYLMFYDTPFNNGGVALSWIMNPTGPMNMQEMFRKSYFNQDISSWDVSTVSTFNGMFQDATSFNQHLDWNTQVTDFNYMFAGATSFNNGDYPFNWSINPTSSMIRMFYGASSFNQDISYLDYTTISIDEFVSYSGLNILNYTTLLKKLSETNKTDVPFNGELMICYDQSYYDILSEKGYTFVNNILSDTFFFKSNQPYTFFTYNRNALTVNDTINPSSFILTFNTGTNTFFLSDNIGSRTVVIDADIIPISPHIPAIPFVENILLLVPPNTVLRFSSELNVAFGIDPSIIIQCISDGDPLPLLTGYVFLSLDIPREFEYSIPIIITQTNNTIDINGTQCSVGQNKIIGDYQINTLYIGSGLFNIELASLPVPLISPICFPAGTPITTDQGKFPIETLTTQTIQGYPIEITKTISPDFYLVCFEKHALSRNIPSTRTIISKDHIIYFGNEKIKAKDYVGTYDDVYKIRYHGQPLYNVLLPIHSTMTVNGMKCETLNPQHVIAKIHKRSGKEQAYILSVLDRLVKQKKFNECRYAVASL